MSNINMSDDPVVRVISKALIPPIMLFALYVQFHGDYGPGGGFQAGVIFAGAFILHAIVFGMEKGQRIWPPTLNLAGMAGGVLIFGGTGLIGISWRMSFLDYDALDNILPMASATKHYGQHYGILLVEAGVGLTVAAVMVGLFFAFVNRANHARSIKGEKK